MQLPIVVSAILPLVIVPGSNGWVGVLVGVVTWLVFLVDLVVQARHLEHYWGTGSGRFDLFVVIAIGGGSRARPVPSGLCGSS